jgi:hypothetical protein
MLCQSGIALPHRKYTVRGRAARLRRRAGSGNRVGQCSRSPKLTTIPPALSSRGPEVEECDLLAGLARSTLSAKCWCYLLPNGELSRILPLSVVAALGVASRRRRYLRRQIERTGRHRVEPYDPSGNGAAVSRSKKR